MSDSWTRCSFGQVAHKRTESWTPGESESVYIGLEHIAPYALRLLGTGLSDEVTSNKTKFRERDTLYGKLRPYFQKVVRPNFSGICSTDIWAIYPADGSQIDPGFLHWVVADPAFSDFANSAETGTRMPRASWQWVSTYELALPPIAEQRQIANVLDTLSERIELGVRIRQLLAEAAQVIIETSSHFCSISDLALTERVQWYPSKNRGQVVDHYSLPAFDNGMVPERVEATAIASNKLRVAEPRVLFSRLNPDTNRTWLCIPSAEVSTSVCSTEYAVLKPQNTSVELLWAALSSGDVGFQLAAASTGTSASHQRVNEEAVLAAVVPDPRGLDSATQSLVTECVFAYAERGGELQRLRETRDFLLPRLVSGELRVAAAEESFAS